MSINNLVKTFLPWAKLVFDSKIKSNEIGLLCPCGIGDTYFACALAKEVSQANQGSSVVAIVKKSHSDIPDLFKDSIVRKVTFDNRQLINSAMLCHNLEPGKVYFAHPSVRFSDRRLSIIGYKNLHLLDLYKFAFNLNREAKLSKPIIPQDVVLSARQRLNKYGLPAGKTVILAPDSNSTPNFHETSVDTFWYDLSEQLIARGYTVVALTNKSSDFLPKISRIDFPLIEAIPFSELCGLVIAARSGLCDLLATAKTKLTILYPDQKWYSGTVYSCSSLQLVGMSKSVKEIVVNESFPPQEIIEQIIDYSFQDDHTLVT